MLYYYVMYTCIYMHACSSVLIKDQTSVSIRNLAKSTVASQPYRGRLISMMVSDELMTVLLEYVNLHQSDSIIMAPFVLA